MPVTAVEVRGITFEEASDTSILLESPGHVTFVDCVVQVSQEFHRATRQYIW